MLPRLPRDMKKFLPLSAALVMVAATAGFAPPARAATIVITANDVSVTACESAIPTGTHCFFVNNKVTATKSGNSVTAVNPVVATVGDMLVLTNEAGKHNVIFCKVGTTVNGWNCGDPIVSGGADPGSANASTAGAPAMITTGAPDNYGGGAGGYSVETYSTTLDSPGTFFFWCGLGRHRFGGQYGKLEVSAQSASSGTPSSSTAAPSVGSAPTLSVKKSGGRITATGRATAGARVTLQKRVGQKWLTVASAKASATGSYTIRAKAETKRTSYRVLVGSKPSATRQA